MPRGSPVLALLVVLGSSPGGAAETPGVGTAARVLDLEGAIAVALRENFGLRQLRHSLAGSQSSLLAAENVFDFKLRTAYSQDLFLDRNVSLELGDPASTFIRDRTSDFETLGLTLTRELAWGGAFEVRGDLSRSRIAHADVEPLHESSFGLAYTHRLLRGRGRRVATAGLVGARLRYLGETRRLAEAEMELAVAVTRAFYQVARSASFIDINRAASERAEDRLRTARLRLAEGLITPIDVARSDREQRVRENAVIAAVESWEDAKDAFVLLLGLPLATGIALDADVAFATSQTDLAAAIAEARDSRIDIRNQRDAVELADLAADVARSESRPRVDLTLEADFVGVSGEAPSKLFDVSPEDTWRAGFVVSHTFGERGDDEALVAALIAAANERLRLEDLERRVERDVRSSVRNVRSLERRVEVLGHGVELARESVRLATLQFEEGLISTVDLLADQDQLVQAETDHVNALYDHAVARANLDLILGRYWTDGSAVTSSFLRPDPAPPWDVVPRRRTAAGGGEP